MKTSLQSPPNRAATQPRFGMTLAGVLVLLGLLPVRFSHGAESTPADLVSRWLLSQTNLQTWSAKVIQERRLSGLVHPLTATGRVWYAAPARFRWELGSPPRSVVIRNPHHLWVVYPHLQQAEYYDLSSGGPGRWNDVLALLDAGFPTSRDDLESRFKVLGEQPRDESFVLTLEPRQRQARRFIPGIRLTLDRQTLALTATSLEFRDGSTVSNRFLDAFANNDLPPDLFEFSPPPEMKIVRPGQSE